MSPSRGWRSLPPLAELGGRIVVEGSSFGVRGPRSDFNSLLGRPAWEERSDKAACA